MKRRKVIVILGVVLLLYVLSIGPAERLSDIKDASDEFPLTTGQKAVEAVYLPVVVVALACPPFDRFLDWYMQLWGMPPEIIPPADRKNSHGQLSR